MPYGGGDVYVKVEAYINGAWIEITTRARGGRAASGVEIERGRGTGALQAEASICRLTLGNDDGFVTEGNPFSPWYLSWGRGCRIRVSVADVAETDIVRFDGTVDTCVAAYPGGSDSSMRITAVGILGGELGLGSEALRSAPQRYLAGLTGTVPAAAWLLEDGPLVTSAAPIYGTEAMRPFVGTHPSGAVVSHPQWGSGTLAPWLPSVVNQSSSSGLSAIWAPVSMPTFTNTWTVDFAYTGTTDSPIRTVDANPSYLGGVAGWPQLTLSPSTGEVSVSFDGSPETTTDAPDLFDGRVHHVRWTATQDGTGVDWEVYVDSVLVNSGTEATYTLQQVWWISFVTEAGSTASVLGYASVWAAAEPVADYTAAIMGHSGETVDERMQRLCDEEDITITIVGTSAQVMGPQGLDKLADLLGDGEAVDGGLLSDGGDGGGLIYRCLETIVNQEAALAVTRGSLDVDVAPIWDNRNIRNDWTISRPGGSSEQYSDEEHVARTNKRIKDSESLNVQADDVLRHQAGWRVNVGTADGPRYNGVGINLRNDDGKHLAEAVLALTAGDRFTAAEATLPAQHPPGGIDGLVIGWTEHLDKDRWLFAPNVVPYGPYNIGVWGTSRWAAPWHWLAAPVDETDTTWSVGTEAGKWPWVDGNSGPEFPLYIEVGGLVYEVTEISGTSSPQTFTVTRRGPGLDKSHDMDTPVRAYQPLRWSLPTS